MCGIFAVYGLKGEERENRKRINKLAKRIRHRGPDWSSLHSEVDAETGVGNYLAHERLAIVSPGESGDQPLFNEKRNLCWIVNGEIYNHSKLKEEHDIKPPSNSDSEVVGYLYEKYGESFTHMLDGMYAFVVMDKDTGRVFAGRDHMGICSMYIGYGKDGSIWFASEMKCMIDDPVIERYEIFPPGHTFSAGPDGIEGFKRWYNPAWLDQDRIPTEPANLEKIKENCINAVVKRLMTDVPFGVLLSGGLDSSLVTAITVRHMKEATNSLAFSEKLHTFSIGIKGAPDLENAKKVADFLGTEHHEFHFTPQEALDALEDVIWHLESWEQCRASVPMFLLSRKIKAMGIKMVMSGEGADETLGGYLYFHKAPDAAEFHRETVRKTTRLHQWDVLRANKSTQAWGLEARVPFLDKAVLECVMNIDPADKMIDMKKKDEDGHPFMEKYLLRKAFDNGEYLPDEVLWRQKEQFSDGVGYDWVDSLKEYAEVEVSDEDFEARFQRFPEDTPETKEYYLLRSIFENHFSQGMSAGQCAIDTVPVGKSIACSTPEAVSWDPNWLLSTGDISGRAVDVHDSADGFELGTSDIAAPKEKSSTGVQAALQAYTVRTQARSLRKTVAAPKLGAFQGFRPAAAFTATRTARTQLPRAVSGRVTMARALAL